MKIRIILFGGIASCILFIANCNNAERKMETEQTENLMQNAGSPASVPIPDTDTSKKVYHNYIKDQIDSLTRLIEQKPTEPEYYQRRGDLRVLTGDNARACEDYKKAESLGAENMQSLLDKNCK